MPHSYICFGQIAPKPVITIESLIPTWTVSFTSCADILSRLDLNLILSNLNVSWIYVV